jgi:phosphoglycerol transferase MdoB-like AlkP superfamily enzyme
MKLKLVFIVSTFISFLYNLIINRYSETIYNTFKQIVVLIVIIIVFLSLLNFFLIRKGVKPTKIVLICGLLIIFIWFLILIPFERGKEIDEIKRNGQLIVGCINSYNNLNKTLPDKLSDLYPLDCDSNYFKYKEGTYSYRKIIPKDLSQREYYYLTFHTNFLETEYLLFDIKKGVFILTDD